jgi:hypothetical protein
VTRGEIAVRKKELARKKSKKREKEESGEDESGAHISDA